MTEHPEYRGLLADVLANPSDDAPRLILADWLEDHGRAEAERARAEFIRLQIELSAGSGDVRFESREVELEGLHAREFLFEGRAYIPRSFGFRFERGFATAVRMTHSAWLSHGPALMKAHPLERVELSNREPYLWDGGAEWRRGSAGAPEGETARRAALADKVWALLAGHDTAARRVHLWKTYSGEAAALDAMSDALLLWARDPKRGASLPLSGRLVRKWWT